jgi:hypothetical protein
MSLGILGSSSEQSCKVKKEEKIKDDYYTVECDNESMPISRFHLVVIIMGAGVFTILLILSLPLLGIGPRPHNDDGNGDNGYITNQTVTIAGGQSTPSGVFKLEGIFVDHVTGRQYIEYPVGVSEGLAVSLGIGDTATNGCTVHAKLVSINVAAGTAIFQETVNTDPNVMCPICWWDLEMRLRATGQERIT